MRQVLIVSQSLDHQLPLLATEETEDRDSCANCVAAAAAAAAMEGYGSLQKGSKKCLLLRSYYARRDAKAELLADSTIKIQGCPRHFGRLWAGRFDLGR